MTPRRFPDSEISGSKPASGSPELIAAVHVLHRLPAPRHPPCALRSLTVSRRRTPNRRRRSSVPKPRAARCIPSIGCAAFPLLDALDSVVKERRPAGPNRRALPGRRTAAHPAGRGRPSRRRGADRVRTDDPRLAKPMLSRLSYSPIEWAWAGSNCRPHAYQACALAA